MNKLDKLRISLVEWGKLVRAKIEGLQLVLSKRLEGLMVGA